MSQTKYNFKQMKRLIQRFRNSGLFRPGIFHYKRVGFWLKNLFMYVYFTFYFRGKIKMYFVHTDSAPNLSEEIINLYHKTKIIGWAEIYKFFSLELKGIVTFAIQKEEKVKNGLHYLDVHLDRYIK